jgi:CRP-like cAMP-binding protein
MPTEPSTRFPYPGDVADFLLGAAWMKVLSAEQRLRVMQSAFCLDYGKGQRVAKRGDSASAWHGVVVGLLKASGHSLAGDRLFFTCVFSGGWLGEGSVLKGEPRRYDVVAMKPSVVVHIPRAIVQWLFEVSIEFTRFIALHLNARLGQYISLFEAERFRDPELRLAQGILSFFDPVLYPDAKRVLPLSQAEIGEMIGLSRQRTNAALKRLQQLALLVPEHGAVRVLDLSRLRDYVASAAWHSDALKSGVPANAA